MLRVVSFGEDQFVTNTQLQNWSFATNTQVPGTILIDGQTIIFLSSGGAGAAQEVMKHYDKNGDGQLDRIERRGLAGKTHLADTDNDAQVSLPELTNWLQETPPATATDQDWFVARDVDRDGQVSMAEYAAKWTDELVQEFDRYDVDRDGVISAGEYGGRRFARLEQGRSSQPARRR